MIEEQIFPIIKNNPKHYRAAVQAAAFSILSDGKMLGVNLDREQLARAAAKSALGIKMMLESFEPLHPENRPVVRAAWDKAVEAAKQAIAKNGPMRREKLI